MLNGHPQVVWQRGWETVADAITNFGQGTLDSQLIELEDFQHFTATNRDDLKLHLDEKIGRLLAEQNKDVFGATCHLGFKALPNVWRSAKFIHLIRDPRDIAISNMKLGWAGHFYFASEAWAEAERDWDFLSTILPDDQIMDIRYENLVANPEIELRRVCDFLGIEYTANLFDYVNTSSYSYPKKELSFRWREQLSRKEVQLIESRIRLLMADRGYEVSTDEKKFSSAAVARFKLRSVWAKRMKRIKRYGLLHVLMDKLARLLNWKLLINSMAKAEAAKGKKHLSRLEKNY